MNLKKKIGFFNTKTDIDKSLVQNAKFSKNKVKRQIQKIGSFMAGMIMPTVSILIAWGLITAMFLGKYVDGKWVATGWFNFEPFGQLVGPTMKWLIPVLVAYTAGNMIYKTRGGMLASFLVVCAIIGNDFLYKTLMADWKFAEGTVGKAGAPNQIVAAMIISPLFVYITKKVEILYINRIKPGFEMLVRNFSLAGFAIMFGLSIFWIWPFVMYSISWVMIQIINLFTKLPWLFPFMSIFTEPLRSVFLNNALNWGVMIPIGLQEVQLKGFSGFFMVGGNPGPGFGLLIAYVVWRKQQRGAASGASLIQLIGGIHEVHYVYILSEPIMILATISGAFTSLSIVKLLAGGATAAISPGSLISVISVAGTGYRIAINVLAVFSGAIVSFLVASLIMKFKKKHNSVVMGVEVGDDGVKFNNEQNSNQKQNNNSNNQFDWSKVKNIVVACDAGVGSSAMAAGILKKWVKDNQIDVNVSNCAVKDLTNQIDVVITMNNFVEFAKEKSPNAYIFGVNKFLGPNIYDPIKNELLKNKKDNNDKK
ncbi:PTS system mannitol-specific EIICB component [Mycoplasma feriruminatoris]|uniref:PTS lactose transporter subunit IIB n=1 Tax=Mycoplasma feriruminatoris TaxID=1179777 RepID=UPI00241D20B2|nr:PTS lactose transporter subunit IIB [Mycoplasma feriruminatoris]WFQ91805.1 PTS system mannitol-specific EIICB component [Mycoplasma feriruminatoris]